MCLKDRFAEVGPRVIKNTDSKMPRQSALDNLDFEKEHLMLMCSLKEQVDTSHLSVEALPKAEALKLFTKDQLLLNSPQLAGEKKYLIEEVLVNAWGRILAKRRKARAGKLSQFFPVHHRHSLSSLRLQAAITFINKIYPFQETKYSHMAQMAFQVQREHLDEVRSGLA